MIRPGIRRLFRLALRRRSEAAVSRDVDAEIELHLQLRVEQLVRGGWARERAVAEARRRFGDEQATRATLQTTAHHRENTMRFAESLDTLRADATYALRGIRREPLVSAFIVATFALGIGANAAMYGVVDRLLLQGPAHVEHSSDVKRLYLTVQLPGPRVVTTGTFGYASYDVVRQHAQSFEAVAAYFVRPGGATLVRGLETRPIALGASTPSLFPLLGTQPRRGRFFSPEEDALGAAANVAVISERFWKTEYGGDAAIVGREINLSNRMYTIIGVAPPGFTGPELGRADVWVPMNSQQQSVSDATDWNSQWLKIVARLKPGASPVRANDEVTAVHRAGYGGTDAAWKRGSLTALPLRFTEDGREPPEAGVSRWLVGVSVVVLLIACSNIVNLLLARAARRKREIAVRLALGAGRSRLVRLLVTESTVLAMLGAVAGLGVAYGTAQLVRSVLLPDIEWVASPVSLAVLGVSFAIAISLGFLVGLVPALRSTATDLTSDLKAGARDSGRSLSPLRRTLTVAQAALSVVLLVGAGLFVRSLVAIDSLDLGIQPDRVLVTQLSWPALQSPTPEERARERQRRTLVYMQLRDRMQTDDGVERASLAVGLPFGFAFSQPLRVQGWDSLPRLQSGSPRISAIAPEYFETVGGRMLRGRAFTTADRHGSELVAIVNETMARTLWPNRDPIGDCLYTGTRDAPCSRVVGVAADARRARLREVAGMHYFVPFGQEVGMGGTTLLTRPRDTNTDAIVPVIARIAREVDPGLFTIRSSTLQSSIDPQIRPWRLGATVFGMMGVLALLVASVGLYSVMSYFVAQRTREIGVRLALGASPLSVVRLVVTGSVTFVVIGIVLGVGIALAVGRYLQPLLFDTSARDGVVIATVALTLLVTGVLAGVGPALRARRINPLDALGRE